MEKEHKRIILQVILFITTFVTTTLAGAMWCYGKVLILVMPLVWNPAFTWNDFLNGMHFSIPFLGILTVHEFGHYFTARHHKVPSSLPYYIPIPPFPFFIGTLGAVIRLRKPVPSNKQSFDIGIAGPLAGFIMTLFVLWYGFSTLPPIDYLYSIHPEYKQFGPNYADKVYDKAYLGEDAIDIMVGKNILYTWFEKTVGDPSRVPNVHEIMHYPYLFAALLSLVFTAINLLPIGQLDGGHIIYGLLGSKRHRIVASAAFILFMFYAGLGLVQYYAPSVFLTYTVPHYISAPVVIVFLYYVFKGLGLTPRTTIMIALLVFATQFIITRFYPGIEGASGWLLFGFLIGRLIGIQHPPCEIEEPLDRWRKIIGWIAILIFIISFTPAPLVFQ